MSPQRKDETMAPSPDGTKLSGGTPVPPATFTLTIPNDNLTAWMFINNAFTKVRLDKQGIAWDPAKHYWNGALFQFGKYKRLVGLGVIDILESVIIERPAAPVTVTRAEFEAATEPIWINVVGGQTEREDPMTKDDLPLPFFNPPKSLHAYLTPYQGGITLWQYYPEELNLRALQSGYRNGFVFSLKPAAGYRVELHQPGGNQYTFTDVTGILVKSSANGGGDGDRINPPQKP